MSSSESVLKVLLVDDHILILEGIKARLDQEEGIAVVGQAADGLNALAQVEDLRPDVVVMDVSMPNMNGIETTKILHERYPDLKVLILSMHDNREYISQLMSHGAKGYILKDISVEEMVRAIRTVADGATYICRAATETLFNSEQSSGSAASKLTRREEAILIRVAKGLSSKAISNELNISVRTVETHRQNIKAKLVLNTTAELTKYAYDQHLI
ncbi:response regulator transcription factor [Marinobacter confluentis]|uniref:Response regulator transcription factor n=1 Tax=Marinobacter confluentis TaxID=1697557 RepID=A0A4Z1BL13_9GAMM|nr:response regulator transcription factor [Marinobacter confluentis]TGN40457.1 response regulator transcription factor [Marinobacter confluentis]